MTRETDLTPCPDCGQPTRGMPYCGTCDPDGRRDARQPSLARSAHESSLPGVSNRAESELSVSRSCVECERLVRQRDALLDALKATNAEVIHYGTSPDTYDWAQMLKRTRANAQFWKDER